MRNLTDIFRIDLRALAILRIGLGVLILWDLLSRVRWLEACYTDAGFYTVEYSKAGSDAGAWSLFWLNGSYGFALSLWIVTALAAVLLILGLKTRLATIACLVLCYSMFVRMPLVLDGGHVLLRMLLFWSVFLPLGAVWSLDSQRLKKKTVEGKRRSWLMTLINGDYFDWKPGDSVCNFATAAILLQVAAMYFFSGVAKCHADWWQGDALFRAMSMSIYLKPLAHEIRLLPDALLLWMGRALVFFELVGPIVIFLPRIFRPARMFFIIWFWGMHIGILFTLSIGIFAAVAMLSWVLFFPWRGVRQTKTALDVRPQKASRTLFHAEQIVCAGFLLFVLLLNVSNMRFAAASYALPQGWSSLGWFTMCEQEFRMFGNPPEYDLMVFAYASETPNGISKSGSSLVDPALAPTQLPDHAMRRLFFNLDYYHELDPELVERIRHSLGEYLHHKNGGFESRITVSRISILESSAGSITTLREHIWWDSDTIEPEP